MKKVQKLVCQEPGQGRCFECCIATITGLGMKNFPEGMMEGDFYRNVNQVLSRLGWAYLEVPYATAIKCKMLTCSHQGMLVVLTGAMTLNPAVQHCVVGQCRPDGIPEYFHDPHDAQRYNVWPPSYIGFLVRRT